MSQIKMIQLTKSKWEIRATKSDTVIQSDIHLKTVDDAIEYIKAYTSSFLGWSWELVELKGVNNPRR